ncbi:K(+)-transporting ATPase subunit C [Lyngbya confervoides]|uniref:Potassium-transporting ATPase KdpC subunit n=1 Tax=Lyngbya confervoides BDU141951 TaxID=1574623 RepID=A0ABD4T6E8_9CYAN|nr:K(+)-transporting ATPase subunit C [Lyngbya confervoides]MCM1984028.1 K(+)-transporting ATPase subunit C [Lyngbya confervoides BDU141951]
MKNLLISIRSTALLWVLTAFLYPAVILVFGQVAFPYQANGSLMTNAQGELIGSRLIGQSFTSDEYFWGRPSTVNYSTGDEAAPTGISGASNLAPDNSNLHSRLQAEVQRLKGLGIDPTADLLYSSGSGLDPHISPAAAQAQINRVAQARSLSPDQLETLIAEHTDHRFLELLGEPGVNVLTLNVALDSL